jgi:hypothetical protein
VFGEKKQIKMSSGLKREDKISERGNKRGMTTHPSLKDPYFYCSTRGFGNQSPCIFPRDPPRTR